LKGKPRNQGRSKEGTVASREGRSQYLGKTSFCISKERILEDRRLCGQTVLRPKGGRKSISMARRVRVLSVKAAF